MRRSNNTLMANDHGMHPVSSNRRRPPRTGWGFIVPVLVVCAALWFLLNANHV